MLRTEVMEAPESLGKEGKPEEQSKSSSLTENNTRGPAYRGKEQRLLQDRTAGCSASCPELNHH